jgi:hypothetical protein
LKLPGFIGPSYKLASCSVDCQESINLYLEADERQTGKNGEPFSLVSAPGLLELADLNNGLKWRGLHYGPNGVLYGVAGNKVYKINSDWTITPLVINGSGALGIETFEGRVQFCEFNYTICFTHECQANRGGIVEINLTTEAVRDFTAVGVGAGRVAEAGSIEFTGDGLRPYSLVTKNQRLLAAAYWQSGLVGGQIPGRVFFSNLGLTTWSAGDFLSAEYQRDVVTCLAVWNDYIWIGGDASIEVFQVTTDPNIPYLRVQGAVADVGVIGRSFVTLADQLFWVGNERQGGFGIYMAEGFKGRRISDHGVETALSSYSRIDDVVGWGYTEAGHHFLVYSFPTANRTWVYDLATGSWHERLSYDKAPGEGGVLGRYRAGCHAFAYGVHVVGDFNSGKLYALDPDYYYDGTLPLLRQRTSPHVAADLKRIYHHKFQVDCEFGVGLDGVGQGTDPVIEYQYSNDGGFNWSSWKRGSLGKIGAKLTRAIWRMLGSSRDRVHRVRISDPVKVRIIGTDVDMSVENG